MGRQGFLAVKGLLFPGVCLGCGGSALWPAKGLCPLCLQGVVLIPAGGCPGCGREYRDGAPGAHLCGACLVKRPPFATSRAIVRYQDPVAGLLQALKYQGDLAVLTALREIVALGEPVSLGAGERVIPVPLHISRLRQRGFNQALVLARLFFPAAKGRILVDALCRIRASVPQAGLSGAARRKNLRGAFRVREGADLMGRKVCLVDDVLTTGSTVSECSLALLAAGVKEVEVLTLARVSEAWMR